MAYRKFECRTVPTGPEIAQALTHLEMEGFTFHSMIDRGDDEGGWADVLVSTPVPIMICEDCGDMADLFMLTDPLWNGVSGGNMRAVFCWSCTEARLGRSIVEADLKLVPANRVYARLLRRLESFGDGKVFR